MLIYLEISKDLLSASKFIEKAEEFVSNAYSNQIKNYSLRILAVIVRKGDTKLP